MSKKYIDKSYLGKDIGNFTIVDVRKSKFSGAAIWDLNCGECGNKIEVIASEAVRGRHVSCIECGNTISNNEEDKEKNNSLELYNKNRIKKIWVHLMKKCYWKTYTSYENYGGKGIKLATDWVNDFDNFYNWSIQNGYGDYKRLMRYDNSLDYSPDNCYWATKGEKVESKDSEVSNEVIDDTLIAFGIDTNKIKFSGLRLYNDINSFDIQEDKLWGLRRTANNLIKTRNSLSKTLVYLEILHLRGDLIGKGVDFDRASKNLSNSINQINTVINMLNRDK